LSRVLSKRALSKALSRALILGGVEEARGVKGL